MRMNMMNSAAADVASGCRRSFSRTFTQAEGFFKAMKAQDAVDTAKANV